MRVLLVDDDPEVRATMANILRALNMAVVEAESGPAALNQLRRDAGFDVLITDFAMPEMTGAVLADRAVAMVPRLKVLMVTGFAGGAAEEGFTWPVLKKPFKAADIEAALRELTEIPNVVPLGRGRGAVASN